MVNTGTRGRRRKHSAAALGRNTKVVCGCGCNKRLSSAQSARHMRGLAPRFIAASSAYRRAADLSYIQTGFTSNALTAPAYLSENISTADRGVEIYSDDDTMLQNDFDLGDEVGYEDNDQVDPGYVADNVTAGGFHNPASGTGTTLAFSAATGEHLSDSSDPSSDDELPNFNDRESECDDWFHDPLDDYAFDLNLANDELTDNGRDLPAEELLGEDFEREAADNENRITVEDLHILRAFQFKHTYFLSQSAFRALPFVFPQLRIPSIHRIKTRVHFLSGLVTNSYDCCVNSCCCFVGGYQADISCRFCSEPRYAADGKTGRKHYSYSPLIPRLRGMYENKALCKELLYRHEYQRPQSAGTDEQFQNPDDDIAITDIWDGDVYNNLKRRHIKINGRELQAKYFSDPHDLALGLTTDGFSPWRRRKYTAWPILIINYNLPPDKRNHQKNIIPISIIPGPKKPKDIDSFLFPLIEELLQLSDGVRAFDASTGEIFRLRAFLLLAFGDMPAVSLLMKMKGHNGITPCRCCKIHGLPVPDSSNKTHYVPLDRSSHPEAGRILKYDPKQLPMRTHEEFLSDAESVATARTLAVEDTLAKESGIKGKTILISLDSLSFPHSFPYDFMHLIYENLIKNLISLWTNDFKGLDTGVGDYALDATVWDAIGAATAKASDTIPSTYSAKLASISGDRSTFTADNFSFWALFVGPVLLRRKFSQQRYYDHFVQLVVLLHICLQYEYTVKDLRVLREGFISWVLTYERLYYQYSPARLPTCPLTIHALLHIVDGIKSCGPVWAYWAFPMERYCGLLQRAVLNSRRHPYVTLDNFIAEDAMISQLKMRYNLYSELNLQPQKGEVVGFQLPTYPSCVLLPPHSTEQLPSVQKDRISAALATRYNVSKTIAKRHLPARIEQWGKVRRVDSDEGDTMNAALLGSASLDRRDATHIRYQTLVDINARNRNQVVRLTTGTFYGQLLRIFCLTMAASPALKLQISETIILVEIQPCKILSKHSSLDIHYYKAYGTPSVMDVTCIQCLVGRVESVASVDGGSNEWAIIDRSGTLAQAYYTGDGST